MVRHWCCTLVHLHTARTNHTGRITVSRNVKNRTSWAKTWQTVPPHPTYSCGCSISFKQGLTFTQFPLTVNRLPRRTAHPEMTSLCYIWFGAKHPDNMWWSRSAVGGEQRGRRVFVRELVRSFEYLKVFLKNKITIGKNTKHWRTDSTAVCLYESARCLKYLNACWLHIKLLLNQGF